MKKILWAGIQAGVVMIVLFMANGWAFQSLFSSLNDEYRNACLFRPWTDPAMSLAFIVPIATAFLLAWLWTRVKDVMKGSSSVQKGFRFGLIYWGIGLPGMLISYSTFPVSFLMVISWTVGNLIQYPVAGIIIARSMK